MAKVSFTAITPIKTKNDKTIKIGDKEIIIKQYLPIEEKAELVDYIIQSSFDKNGLFSSIRLSIYKTIGLLKWYTNINITDTMLINVEKTYDAIILNNLQNIVYDNLEASEYESINFMIDGAITETKSYLQSFAGQLRSTSNDYDNTKLDLEEIAKSLEDPEKIGFVKDLMEKMG